MIHGMCCGGWCWGDFKKFFEDRSYRCITPTLRFHDMGPKETPSPELGVTSLLDYAEDLEKEINKLDETPILMGHSMGGLLVQILASRGLARAVVILNPAPPNGIMTLKYSTIKSFGGSMKYGFWRKSFRPTFKEIAYSSLNLLTPKEQEEVYDKLVYESGRALFEIGFWFFDSKGASKVDESKITCGVLVVAGGRDRITPASVVKKIAEKYKTVSTYREFTDHAHWTIGEPGWGEIAEYAYNWLNQVLG